MFLEDIATEIANRKTFNRGSEDLLQWPEFKKCIVRNNGPPLSFFGMDEQNATPLVVSVPTAPGPDVIQLEDVEEKTSSESA